MSDRDNVLLSPWEQYQKYHRFPFVLFLHLLLLLLAIYQSLTVAGQFNPHDIANQNMFESYFLQDTYENGLYTINDVLGAVEFSVNSYYALPNNTVTRFAFFREEGGEEWPMFMTMKTYKDLEGRFWNISQHAPFRYSDFAGNFAHNTLSANLTQSNPLGPLQILKDDGYPVENNEFYYITSIVLTCYFHTADVGSISVLPVDWKVTVTFNLKNGGAAEVSLKTEILPVPSIVSLLPVQIASIIILLAAIANISVSIGEIMDRYRILCSTRDAYRVFSRFSTKDDQYPHWNTVTLHMKVSFFSAWSLSNIIASVLLIASQVIILLILQGGDLILPVYTVVMGFGLTMAMFNIMRYLQYNKKFYMFVLIWQYSIGNIVRYIISVSPLYLAYVLFGVLNFSQYSKRFETIDQASVSLFALLNGDDIHATFDDLEMGQYPYEWIARVYLYTFVLLAMTSILNVCIFIIEDAFHIAKECADKQHESSRQKRRDKEKKRLMEHQMRLGTSAASYDLMQSEEKEKEHVHDVEKCAPENEWCRQCREEPEKKENARGSASETSKDLIRILFDNLEKWQEMAVGPDYRGKAEEERMERKEWRSVGDEATDIELDSSDALDKSIEKPLTDSDSDLFIVDAPPPSRSSLSPSHSHSHSHSHAHSPSNSHKHKKEKGKKEKEGSEGAMKEMFEKSVREMLKRQEMMFQSEISSLRGQLNTLLQEVRRENSLI